MVKILLTPDVIDLGGSQGRQQAISMTNDLKSYWQDHPGTFVRRVLEGVQNREEIGNLLDNKLDRTKTEFIRRILSPIIPYDKSKAK